MMFSVPVDPTSEKPALFILSPLPSENEMLADEACLAAGFVSTDKEMVLNVKGDRVSMKTSGAVMSLQQKNFYAGFTNKTIYSCELNETFTNNHQGTAAAAAAAVRIWRYAYVRSSL